MKCSKCSKEIPAESKFCCYCGQEAKKEEYDFNKSINSMEEMMKKTGKELWSYRLFLDSDSGIKKKYRNFIKTNKALKNKLKDIDRIFNKPI